MAPPSVSISSESFARFDRLSFVSRRAARAGLGGEHRSRNRSPSTDFVDFRPYQPGDDFRRVDWNVYGRLGSLQVKLTEGRERLDITLALDCSGSMDYGQPAKLRFAAQLLAGLGYVGLARSDTVRIVCLVSDDRSARLGMFQRRSRFADLVDQLSTVAPAGLLDLNASLGTCLPVGARQPLVVLVSDLLSPVGLSVGLDALQSRQADVVVLHVVSPEEMDPALSGELELVDAETSQTLQLGVSLETLAAYRARFARWLAECEAECMQHGMRYARVSTDRPLASVILDDLRRAGVLR